MLCSVAIIRDTAERYRCCLFIGQRTDVCEAAHDQIRRFERSGSEAHVVMWGPEAGGMDRRHEPNVERTSVRLPLDSIFRSGAIARDKAANRVVLGYVVFGDGE
jgi:hypothetical protein